jgi:hypothetical protein
LGSNSRVRCDIASEPVPSAPVRICSIKGQRERRDLSTGAPYMQ